MKVKNNPGLFAVIRTGSTGGCNQLTAAKLTSLDRLSEPGSVLNRAEQSVAMATSNIVTFIGGNHLCVKCEKFVRKRTGF